MFSGTFKEGFSTKYGNTVVVTNQKGDWTLYGREMRAPDFKAGDEVQFEAEKKPAKNGKSYWHYSSLTLKGQSTEEKQTSNNSGDGFRQMFITGIVGRAMGSGKFDAADIEGLTIAAAQAFDNLVNHHDALAAPNKDDEIPY